MRTARGHGAKDWLHQATGRAVPDKRRLTLFEIWHYGLNPAALLLMLATRYGEAAAITRVILKTPDKAIGADALDFQIWPTRAEAEKIAKDMADEIMPDATPSFDNTKKNFKFGCVFIKRHGAGTALSASEERERLMFECLDPLYNALPSQLRHLPDNVWMRPPGAKRKP